MAAVDDRVFDPATGCTSRVMEVRNASSALSNFIDVHGRSTAAQHPARRPG